MDTTLTPADRPRKGAIAVLAVALLAGIVTVAAVVGTPERAAASGLERFGSCAELEQWGADRPSSSSRSSGSGSVAEDAAATTAAGAPELQAGDDGAASANSRSGASTETGAVADEATGETNVVVEGVDELDIVDHLGDGRLLVVGPTVLGIVDLGGTELVAEHTVPNGSQVTYDADAAIAWVVGPSADGGRVEVERVRVGDDLDSAGTWATDGQLVDARRVGGRLHLVATEGMYAMPTDGIPFEDGPVPCDQVLHPAEPGEPAATLLVTLPVAGDLAPTHAAEVVGSGQLVHVTTDAAYLATPQYGGSSPTTGIHRFDLDDLTHTGSGSVDGSLLNDFSMSEHDGHLRVAITHGWGGGVGRPIAIDTVAPVPAMGGDGDAAVDDGAASDGGARATSDGTTSATAEDVAPGEPTTQEPTEETPTVEEQPVEQIDEAVPTTTEAPTASDEKVAQVPATMVPATTAPDPAPTPDPTAPEPTDPEPTVPPVTGPEPEPEPTVPETTVPPVTEPEPEPTVPGTLVPEPTVPEPQPGDALNEIVVLDIEGDLDEVGRTQRFGLPDETLFGIRFDGDTAYAVTFLQTDPFYVVDLADPTAPTVVGEVKLPGFSSYLHPVGDDRVVGFGPDGDGQAAAKLFDVSDPTKPTVVDEVTIGGDSPITYDHHAFTDLGDGRFAVPTNRWDQVGVTDCPDDARCLPKTGAEVVVMEVDGSQLVEQDRIELGLAGYDTALRAIPTGDGWAVVGSSQVAFVDDAGAAGPILPLR